MQRTRNPLDSDLWFPPRRKAAKNAKDFASLAVLCLCCALIAFAKQQPSNPPDFARDILPILRNSCVACHDADLASGGLRLDTYQGLMKGGAHGAAIVPGKSSKSRMMLMIEGKIKPEMPMGGGPLMADEIAAIKAWIDGGAKGPETKANDRGPARPVVPEIKPHASLLAQVSSLAFHPRESLLAVAGYKEVKLIDPARSRNSRSLTGPSDVVRALAYSRDARYLAAAGGVPARYGEVVVWNAADGKLARTLRGHSDYVYSVAFSPDGKMIATSSYDKLVKLWDVETGRELKTLKDHIDAVYPLEFSPDGKWLASGSADRTVKVWDVESGRRIFTLSDALDAIYALAFHPSGKTITAAGADKCIRTWELSAEGGTLASSIIAHEETIIGLEYSPDGKYLVSTGQDRLIKIWDVHKGVEIRVLERQPDWALGVAFSPDGRKLAIGRYDGSVSVYDMTSGARVDLIRPPAESIKPARARQ